jgi:glycine/D-amino acid oxidase-like deaminating enzyme/nitrite reductase/ring-hydroxylating ferredoxin subunit
VGTLDEENPSLWIKTSEATPFKPLSRAVDVDAVVIGAGITGLTAALMLKREGLKVAVLEAGRVASGVTGYTTAKVTALHGLIYQELADRHGAERAAAYAAANAAAVERIRTTVEEEGIDCDLVRADAYTYAETMGGAAAVEREVSACIAAGLPAEAVEETTLPFPITKAVRLADQAAFHPRKYCLGLAAAIHGGKGRVYEHSRVHEVEEKKRVVTIKTEKVKLSTKHVVVATQIPFMGDGRFYAKTYPMRAYAMAVRLRTRPLEGMYISAEEPIRSIRPYVSGRTQRMIVGGESHKVGQEPDTQEHYAAIEKWARHRLPGFEKAEYQWSAQDYVAVDGMPYVGRLSEDHERVFVATGFRKWGMTNGTAAAAIISDAILGRENPWAEAFDSTRKRPRAAAKDFVKENLNVAKHLVLDKVITGTVSLDEIGPEQAAFVEIDGETVAVYRDEQARFHAVSADCTHMGCRLAFNPTERSWDCPCHGSRFDPDGRVIQGPANQDLEKKEIREPARR